MVLLESVYNDDGCTYLLFGEPLLVVLLLLETTNPKSNRNGCQLQLFKSADRSWKRKTEGNIYLQTRIPPSVRRSPSPRR